MEWQLMIKKSLCCAFLAILIAGCSQSKPEPAEEVSSAPPDSVVPLKDGAINPIGINVSIMAPPAAYDSPEAAFDAFVAAVEEDKLRVAADVLAPGTQTAVAGSLAFRLSLSAAAANYKADKVARLFDVHGLNKGESGVTEDNGAASMMRSIGETIRFRNVFIDRATRLLRDMDKEVGDYFQTGTLEDLQVDELTAVATLMIDDENSRPIEFECRGGAWLIQIPDQVFEQ